MKQAIGKKTIQNNREKSDKPRGGQLNHKQQKLEHFKEDEITEKEVFTLDKCPYCGGELKKINVVISDILDVEVSIIKNRNEIENYRCCNWHRNVTANDKLPRGVSYGQNINAMCLLAMNESNKALNKVC